MADFAKMSNIYVGAVILCSTLVLLLRSDWFSDQSDWGTAVAVGSSSVYREYYAKWRSGERSSKALSAWEKALKDEYAKLDWTSSHSVSTFIKDHPEFDESEIRTAQYEAVVKNGSYRVLSEYVNDHTAEESQLAEAERLIDELILKEVKPAIERNDYQELRHLSKRYSDWSGRQDWIDSRITLALENSAKEEWGRLANSRSEEDLRVFITKYSETGYADLAARRIKALYSDFDFVRQRGSLRAYAAFVENHSDSAQVKEAYQCIATELERYVFNRKILNKPDETLVKSLLAKYERVPPCSGAIYGQGGRYSSPLKIITPPYGSEDYFVKLVNKYTGASVGIYVRAGATTEVAIPDGTYSIRYATGSKWYGPRLLFGLNAHYSRAGRDFTFDGGHGYSLTLQRVINGNLHTSSMPANEF